MGNGEAKELICTTHGCELRWGNDHGRGGAGWRWVKGRKIGIDYAITTITVVIV